MVYTNIYINYLTFIHYCLFGLDFVPFPIHSGKTDLLMLDYQYSLFDLEQTKSLSLC